MGQLSTDFIQIFGAVAYRFSTIISMFTVLLLKNVLSKVNSAICQIKLQEEKSLNVK